MRYWNYREEYYIRVRSEVVLDEKRIRKLERVKGEGLLEIAEAMRRDRRAACREAMPDYAFEIPMTKICCSRSSRHLFAPVPGNGVP